MLQRVDKMIQRAKCPLLKNELSLDSQYPWKSLEWRFTSVTPVLEMGDEESREISGTLWSVSLVKLESPRLSDRFYH